MKTLNALFFLGRVPEEDYIERHIFDIRNRWEWPGVVRIKAPRADWGPM
jgi:hypothetical protein